MSFRLSTKITFAFASLAALLIVVMGLMTKTMLENNFKDYVIQKQDNTNRDIVSRLQMQYESEGKWMNDMLENIGVNALEQGLVIKVSDTSGNVLWDANVHNKGMCQEMLSHMANNMSSKYPSSNGEYTEKKYSITSGKTNMGTVDIGYYGPYFFTDQDLHYINALNTALLWVSLFAFALSWFIGQQFAKRISIPILRVVENAKLLELGKFLTKDEKVTTTTEINQLINTVNNLSHTLQEQDILRKRLTSDVAHELRTPLSTLQGHLEAMIDGIWQPTPDRLKSCHEEVVRINKMVGELHQLENYQSDTLNESEFSLNDLISGIMLNFESQFKSSGVALTLQGNAKINADSDKISQVITNLLSNALKYTPSGGIVAVNIIDLENSVEISITDTGCGIAKEHLPHIFERFYRADSSRNRLTGGSGIGLAIVKMIVEAHDGTIAAESIEGKGAMFLIKLPKNI